MGIWINNLISESSVGEVRSLRDIEDLFNRRFVKRSSEQGPEFTQNSEQRTLSATVGTGNHEMHAWLDGERHLFYQSVTIGRKDRHFVENNFLTQCDFALILQRVIHE
jgi:hypothetical protein